MTESTFIQFRDAVNKQFDKITRGNIFESAVEKDLIWDTHLNAFPEGTNNLFRERTEHDCSCCKHFIRNVGRILGEVNGELKSVFDDLQLTGHYKIVADKLAELNRNAGIAGIYLNDMQKVGQRENFETLEDGTVHQWDHFYQVLPSKAYSTRGDIGTRKGKAQTNCKVLKRSITEITQYAVDTVIELIEQNSLYRGTEFLAIVKGLKSLQVEYTRASDKQLFLWNKTLYMQDHNYDCNIRGTVIGTLLVDLSNEEDLEVAVKKFEDKVSGTNYKRTTALVTPRMKEEAKKKVQELGVEESLYRRYANKTDISVNDVLFADNSVKPFMEDSIFDSVKVTTGKKQNFDKVEEVSVETFINKILPKAESLEVFVENKHEQNLMSIVAPINTQAPCIMKWGNNFSWCYNGDVADSVIKQSVKSAGGVVDAPLRVSLSWHSRDDLDLHLIEPSGNEVYFGRKSGVTGSRLDVDMRGERLDQVENIYWADLSRLQDGTYKVFVHNYSQNGSRAGEKREEGFDIEVEYNGEIISMGYEKRISNNAKVNVLTFKVKNGDVDFNPAHECTNSFKSKEVWGITTGSFVNVDMVMKSPNYWENSGKTGNEHLFFILKDCKNQDDTRGYYNEYLIDELQPHRKVFEILASQVKAEYSEDQLSGLGFSTTKHTDVTVRVKGSFNRTVKIKF